MEGHKYRCDYCGFETFDQLKMLEHMVTHTTSNDEEPPAEDSASAPESGPATPTTSTVDESSSVPFDEPPRYHPTVTTMGPPPRISMTREDLQAGFRKLNIRAGLLWQDEPFLRNLVYEKAELKNGDRVLLLCEDNEACRFPYEIKQIIGSTGTLEDIDFRSMAYEHFTWDIYNDLCQPYNDDYFDAVITVSWHHIEDLSKEAPALVRVVRPGGTVVMVDHGPADLYFEAMKHDVHLNMVLKLLVTYWGSIWKEDLDEAYEYARGLCLRITPDDVERAFQPLLKDMGRFETRGIALVWGTKA